MYTCRNAVWPGGVRPSHKEGGEGEEGEGEGGERERLLRCVLARAKLIGSVPDDLRRLLGTRRTTQGMARCVGVCVCVRVRVCVCTCTCVHSHSFPHRLSHLLQERSLNCWLCLRLFEASLQCLFPSHSLSTSLRSLRQHLHSGKTL